MRQDVATCCELWQHVRSQRILLQHAGDLWRFCKQAKQRFSRPRLEAGDLWKPDPVWKPFGSPTPSGRRMCRPRLEACPPRLEAGVGRLGQPSPPGRTSPGACRAEGSSGLVKHRSQAIRDDSDHVKQVLRGWRSKRVCVCVCVCVCECVTQSSNTMLPRGYLVFLSQNGTSEDQVPSGSQDTCMHPLNH